MLLHRGIFCSLILLLLASALANVDYQMPDGEEYKTGNKTGDDGVDWYKHVKWFISILTPNDPPIGTILHLTENFHAEEVKDVAMEMLKNEAGFIVFILLGILMFFIMLFTALISCCCFCCGTAIAPKPNPKSDRNRKIMYLVLIGLLLLLLVGVMFMFASSRGLHNAMKNTPKSLNNTFDDANIFLSNTRMQIRYITDDAFGQTIENVQQSLQGVGNNTVRNLKEAAKTDEMFASFGKASEEFSNVIVKLSSVVSFAKKYKDLCTQIVPSPVCPQPGTAPCKNFDDALRSIPCNKGTIDAQMNKINDQIQAMNGAAVTSLHTDVKKEFREISQKVNDQTKSTVAEVSTALGNLKNSVKGADSHLDDLSDTVRNFTDSAKKIVRESIDNPRAQDINDYIYAALNVIAGIILIVWVFLVLGVFFGAICYQQHTFPDERTCSSRCVGFLLLAPVFLLFLFSSLLWLFSTILFFGGGHVQAYVCQPLYDEPDFKFFDKIVDAYGEFRNVDGSYTGFLLLQDSSIDISFSSVLNAWKDNVPAYRAMHLNHLFNVQDKLDDKQLNKEFEEKLDELTTLHFDAFPTDFGSRFISTGNSLNDVDAALHDFESAMNIDDVPIDHLKVCETDGTCDQSTKDKVDAIVKLVEDLKNENIKKKIKDIKDKPVTLKASLDSVSRSLGNLKTTLDKIVKNLTQSYPEEIRQDVNTFIQFVNRSLDESMAGCRPLWNVFDTARTVVCKHVLDPLNGFWFGLGWCLVFLIPSMILAVSLSKHFRRLKYAKGWDADYSTEYVEGGTGK